MNLKDTHPRDDRRLRLYNPDKNVRLQKFACIGNLASIFMPLSLFLVLLRPVLFP